MDLYFLRRSAAKFILFITMQADHVLILLLLYIKPVRQKISKHSSLASKVLGIYDDQDVGRR